VIGLWPSRAVTFLDNHDTGSTLNHWPYPSRNLPEGYCYLLTHGGGCTGGVGRSVVGVCVSASPACTTTRGLRTAIINQSEL